MRQIQGAIKDALTHLVSRVERGPLSDHSHARTYNRSQSARDCIAMRRSSVTDASVLQSNRQYTARNNARIEMLHEHSTAHLFHGAVTRVNICGALPRLQRFWVDVAVDVSGLVTLLLHCT